MCFVQYLETLMWHSSRRSSWWAFIINTLMMVLSPLIHVHTHTHTHTAISPQHLSSESLKQYCIEAVELLERQAGDSTGEERGLQVSSELEKLHKTILQCAGEWVAVWSYIIVNNWSNWLHVKISSGNLNRVSGMITTNYVPHWENYSTTYCMYNNQILC